MPNTLSAHRLLRWAHVQGGGAAQDRLLEALFRRYFTEGEDLGDEAVLTNAVTEAGLDGAAAAPGSQPGKAREVLHEARWSRDNGISGVPCYVLPTGFGIQEPRIRETPRASCAGASSNGKGKTLRAKPKDREMNLAPSPDAEQLLERLRAFMKGEVYPGKRPTTKSSPKRKIAFAPLKTMNLLEGKGAQAAG